MDLTRRNCDGERVVDLSSIPRAQTWPAEARGKPHPRGVTARDAGRIRPTTGAATLARVEQLVDVNLSR